jgi:hypothetical protein
MSLARQILRALVPWARKPLRCTGCGRTREEVAHLVSGPDVYICESCTREAATRLETDLPLKPFTRRCSFCGKIAHIAPLGIDAGHAVCGECTALIVEIIGEARAAAPHG